MKVRHKALKRFRIRQGLTQREVAKLARLSRSCVANIENGHREPLGITLFDIALALNADPRDFVRRDR